MTEESWKSNGETQADGGTRAGLVRAGLLFLLVHLVFSADVHAQPRAQIEFRPQNVPLNRLLHVTLELAWAGEADLYDIPRPDLSAITAFELVEQSVSASRRGKENILTFEMALKPLEEGMHDLGQMTLEYYEKGKDIATPVDVPAAVVTVQPRQLFSPATKGIAAGAVFAACLSAFYLTTRMRNKAKQQMEPEPDDLAGVRASFLAKIDAARQSLIEGETGRYLEELCRMLESDALRLHARKLDELSSLTESVKYGKRSASPDELKWAERIVKQAIGNAFPQPEIQDKVNDIETC